LADKTRYRIWFEGDNIFLESPDKSIASMPLKWFPRLLNATIDERENFELSPYGIHWPELDEDLSYEGFYSYSPKQEVST
jgi:hypothetical protein